MPASDFIADNWDGSGVKMTTIRNAAEPLHELRDAAEPPPIKCVVAGRLDPTKGHHTAVDAIIKARSQGAAITLDIYGGPTDHNPYADELRTAIDNAGMQDAITLKGFCTDLRDRHGDYHLGLQCRIDPEPCSLWVCETMLDGLPLLASATGGTPELIDDGVTGHLYPPGDADAMAALMLSLAEQPGKLSQMRVAAHERGHKNFSLHRFISQTFEAYRDVI